MTEIKTILKSQYRAALDMLQQSIVRCPDNLWVSTDHPNQFWHVAYHALFYLHFYLQRDEAAFRPWSGHRDEYQFLGPLPWPPHRPPKIEEPYTKFEVLEYLRFCKAEIDPAVDKLDLEAPESGFWWYDMSKFEHQFVNIRHLQHHAAQLADRLRQHAGAGIDWIAGKPPEK